MIEFNNKDPEMVSRECNNSATKNYITIWNGHQQ